jgi:hypothetical protein
MQQLDDLTGKSFGCLTVIKRVYIVERQTFWQCICRCGAISNIRAQSIKNGKHNHCKYCSNLAIARRYNSFSTLRIWIGMKNRCYNPDLKEYKYYGKRGIKVCDRWLNSFANFIKDMGIRPKNKQIDRINNDGNYEPSNCRWSTPKQNVHNNSRTIKDNYEYANISRQYKYQLRKKRQDKCQYCGKENNYIKGCCDECYIRRHPLTRIPFKNKKKKIILERTQ